MNLEHNKENEEYIKHTLRWMGQEPAKLPDFKPRAVEESKPDSSNVSGFIFGTKPFDLGD